MKVILGLIVGAILLTGLGVGAYLVQQRTNVLPQAQEACVPPDAVSNVTVTYPSCRQGSTLECSFTQASCSWDAVNDASKYSLKVTEVETGTVITQEELTSTTLEKTFNVTPGRTYKCDVSATNSCGSAGGTGTDSLLCQTEGGLVPTPTPVAVPTPTPQPTIIPTPTPTPQLCGYSPCVNNNSCQPGLICVTTNSGSKYCSMPEYQSKCSSNPSYNSCCTAPPQGAPAPQEKLPPAGAEEQTATIVIFSTSLIILGIFGMAVL